MKIVEKYFSGWSAGVQGRAGWLDNLEVKPPQLPNWGWGLGLSLAIISSAKINAPKNTRFTQHFKEFVNIHSRGNSTLSSSFLHCKVTRISFTPLYVTLLMCVYMKSIRHRNDESTFLSLNTVKIFCHSTISKAFDISIAQLKTLVPF